MKEEKALSNKLDPREDCSVTKIKKGSIFQLIIVACQRHKQLNNGANPRIDLPTLKTKKTKIAIEEVNQDLIFYKSMT